LTPASGRFLLDTNIVIALLDGDDAVLSNLDRAPEVFIPAVALVEPLSHAISMLLANPDV
jgi:predicted nucleic acid-binding protein